MEQQPEVSPEQEAPPPQRSSLGLLLFAVLSLAAAAGGALFYFFSQSGQRQAGSGLDVGGFDVAKVDEAPQRALPVASAGQQQQSSLGMVATGAGYGFSTGETDRNAPQAGANAAPAEKPPAEKFTEICRQNEGRARDLAMAYTKKYPAIAQYGRDWMAKPDLKKLNDDYMRDKDPVKFIRGLAASPSFPGLMKKYATDPAIRGFAKDVIKNAPGGLVSAGVDMAKREGVVGKLMDGVMGALGLPPGMFGNGSAPGKTPDQNQIMNSVMNNNPDMQRAMQQQQTAAPRLQGGFGSLQQNQQQGQQGQPGQEGQPAAGGMPAGMPDMGALMGGGGGGLQGMMNNPQISEALKNNPEAQQKMQGLQQGMPSGQ